MGAGVLDEPGGPERRIVVDLDKLTNLAVVDVVDAPGQPGLL
jgi:hypothetical protein